MAGLPSGRSSSTKPVQSALSQGASWSCDTRAQPPVRSSATVCSTPVAYSWRSVRTDRQALHTVSPAPSARSPCDPVEECAGFRAREVTEAGLATWPRKVSALVGSPVWYAGGERRGCENEGWGRPFPTEFPRGAANGEDGGEPRNVRTTPPVCLSLRDGGGRHGVWRGVGGTPVIRRVGAVRGAGGRRGCAATGRW